MNVNDQWMLERMQQMAANMAASVPQTSQNSETPKTEKGDSFKDLMDKAKDQKVETPKKTETPKKAEKAENVQKTGQKTEAQKVPVQADGKTVEVTAEQAALLAAGYAKLFPSPEGDEMWVVTVRDEDGNLVLPLKALEDASMNYAYQATLVDGEEEWTMEPTPEIIKALEQLLKETDDPRPMDVILGKLAYNKDGTPIEKAMQIVVSNPETEQADEEDATDLSGQIADAQPLFKDVKAAPVKVGENFQLDTQQPDMDDQLAETIRYAAQQGLKQIEIKLSPENLGSLTIKLTQGVDGSLQVVLHAANAKAANLLTQHIDNLNAALQGYSQSSQVEVQVQRGEDSQQAQQQQQQTDPNGHNRQQQEQQRRQEKGHSEDFIQRLRLGLFGDEL